MIFSMYDVMTGSKEWQVPIVKVSQGRAHNGQQNDAVLYEGTGEEVITFFSFTY